MKRLVALALLLAATSQEALAQKSAKPVTPMGDCQLISSAGMSVSGSERSEEAFRNMIDQIVNASGLTRNFEVCAAAVPNAAAVVLNSKRYILFRPSFMDDVLKATGTKWASASIMAHEVGHHLNGHTLTRNGSSPPIELEADRFSGFILQRLGATIQSSKIAMQKLASTNASATHPGKADRVAAITAGWESACKKDPDCFHDNDGGEDGFAAKGE